MTQLWIQPSHQKDGDNLSWELVSLGGDSPVVYLTGDPDHPVVTEIDDIPLIPAYMMRHSDQDGHERWILFTSDQVPVFINGERLNLGIRSLRDRDAIQLGDTMIFFCTENPAQIVPFPGIGKPAKCPRCKLTIPEGSPAVRCPNCGVWHHQSDPYPCWTYSNTCAAFCDHPTTLDGHVHWMPEGM